MTTVIDERVVEMRFNNEDFEKNVAQSMETLEKLKSSLKLEGAANSLEDIGKAASKFSLAGITETITEATSKFSAFEIAGITAISKITSAAMDMGVSFLKSVSLDQISTGFNKYADMTTAIQTIISATGAEISEVEEQVEKLNWFTDETSYSLNDMISNIASFTNNGVQLKDAVPVMMGIATAAGDAGKNAQQASHAMTGFSKAMGTGYMSRSNWQWIETAGVDTIRLKEAFLEAAVEAGTLTKAAEGMYQTLSGKEVTAEDFATNLKEKWLTKDVINSALSVYGDFASRLNEVINDIGFEGTTSDFIKVLDDYKAGLIDVNEASKELGVSSKGLKEILDELSSDEFSIGEHAFKMSQEAKTFQEAIDSVKDAVSTGWMTTFDTIFGNYEEAKKLWTGLANDLWEAFASGGAERNEILKFWKELGGRDSLIEGAVNLANLFVKPISAVKSAFKSMFPDVEGMGRILKDLTDRFKNFTASIQPSEQMLRDIYNIFKGIFTIGKMVGNIFASIIKAIIPAAKPFSSLFEMIIHFLGIVGAVIQVVDRFISQGNVVQVLLSGLGIVFSNLLNILKTVGMVIGGGIAGGVALFISTIQKAVAAIQTFATKSQFVKTIIDGISQAFTRVKSIFTGFNKTTEGVTTVVKHMEENFSGANTVIAQTGTLTRDTTAEFKHAMTPMERFAEILKTIGKVVTTVPAVIIGTIAKIASSIGNFFKSFAARFKEIDASSVTFFDHIKAFFTTLGSYFGEIGEKVGEFFENLFGDKVKGAAEFLSKLGNKFKELASSIDVGMLAAVAFAGAMFALVINIAKVTSAVTEAITSVKGVFDTAKGVLNTINGVIKGQFTKKSNVLLELAESFAIIAASLALLVAVNKNGELKEVADAVLLLVVAFGACAAVLKGLDYLFGSSTKGAKTPLASASLLALAGSIAILAGTMLILQKVTVDKTWYDKLKILGLMLLELVTAAALVSKFAPKLAKGSILLLAMAGAIKLMTDAMLQITGEDLSNVQNNLIGFSVLFGAMALMVAAAGQVKLTSALSLILIAKAMQMIFPQLLAAIKTADDVGKKVNPLIDSVKNTMNKVEVFFKTIAEKYGEIAAIGIGLATGFAGGTVIFFAIQALIKLFTAIGAMGNLLKGVGIAAAGIGVGIALIVKAMEKIAEIRKTLSADEFKQVAIVIGSLMGVMGLVLGFIQLMGVISNVAGKKLLKWTDNLTVNFAAIGIAFMSLGASMILIAAALKIASTINKDDIATVGIVIGGLMAVVGLVVFAASTVKKGMTVMTALIGVVSALAILLAEVAIAALLIKSTDPTILGAAFAGLLVFLGALAGVLAAAGTIKTSLPIFATVLLVVSAVGAIGLALYALQGIPWSAMEGTVMAMASLLTMLTIAVMVLSSVDTNLKSVINTAILLGSVVAALAIVGVGLYALQKVPWESMLSVIKAVGLVLLELVGFVGIFGLLSKFIGNDIKKVLGLIGAALGSLIIVGLALAGLSRFTWDQFVPTIKAVGLVMTEMAGFVAIIAAVSKWLVGNNLSQTLWLIGATIISLFVVGVALYKLSEIPWESLKGPMMAAAGVMGSMDGLILVTGIIAKLLDGSKFLSALALMAGAVGSLVAIGYELQQLAQIPVEDLAKARDNMALMMLAMTGMAAVLALLTTVVGAVAGIFGGGALGFFALPAVILSMAVAIVAIGGAFALAAYSTQIFATGLGMLYEPLQQLSTLDLPTIAAGLGTLGASCIALGVGLGVFGVGGIVGAAAFVALAIALNLFNEKAQQAVPILQSLADLDLGKIALGFIELGAGGVVMIAGAVGVRMFAQAIEVLAAALEKLKGSKEMMSNFFNDMGSSLESGSNKIKNVAKTAGEKVAKAFEGGWRSILKWFSPPGIVTDFLADMGYALSDNGQLIRIADGSAVSIASAFSNGFMSELSDLSGRFGGLLSGMLGMANNFMYKIRGILNATGQEISQFGANGMPTDVIDKMYGGTSTASSFTDMLKEQIHELTGFNGELDVSNYLLGDVTDTIEDMTEGLGGMEEGLDGVGESAGKAGKALSDFRDTLKDTLANQVDMFSKFELKMGVSADQMLENMRSNIDGFASWSHRMTVLAERFAQHGIADSLYKQLAELGPKGYETMNAFYQMTDEQLEEVRGLWQTGLTLPEGQADIVASGYKYMGEMAVKGFSNALDDHKAAHAKAHGLGQAALDGLSEVLKVNSPSKATEEIGRYLVEGLRNGIDSVYGEGILYFAVKHVSEHILELFNEFLSPENVGMIGQELVGNIFTSILENNEDAANPMVQAFIESLQNLDEFDEAVVEFLEHFLTIIIEFFEMDDAESPSQLFYRIATQIIQGLIDGLEDLAIRALLKTTIITLCKDVVDTFTSEWQMIGEEGGIGRSEVFYQIGINAMQGLVDGIEEKGQEAITAAQEIADSVAAIMRSALQINSPSKVIQEIGHSVGEGFVLGIEDGAENVYNAAANLAQNGIDGSAEGLGRLRDVINESLDLNPVITPMLDLSLIREQIAELDGLMNYDPFYDADGQNEGIPYGGSGAINYIQNNYSPKALSRVEIYRQTRNQLSTIRKVVSG